MPTSLKIAIAARGLSSNPSGPTEFISGFTRALLDLPTKHQFALYYNSPEFFGSFPKAEERSLPSRNRFIWDHLLLPLALHQDRVDVVILPKGTMPLCGAGRALVVMHDLGYFYPHLNAYRRLETIYMRNGMRRAARRAWGIFTVSDYTRQDVIRLLGAHPNRVLSIYEAPDPQYETPVDLARLAKVRIRYQLREPFIFYPTSISPRKNILRLLDAFEIVQGSLPHHLYLTGGHSWNSREIERRMEGNTANRVHRLGVVDPQDMPALYALSDFTVYVSLFEGFGLPVLEAFRCGSPVMISDQTCLPEVAAGAALIVDGYDVEALAAGLVELSNNKDLRGRLRQMGYERAQAFSWDRTARLALTWIDEHWHEPHR